MNPDNVYKYIYTGSMFNEDEKLYRKTCFGPLLLTLLGGLTPGGILKGFWPFLSLAMAVGSLACGIAVFVLASDFLTVKEALRLDVITTVAWVFDFSILNIMYFTMLKGFTPWVLLINLPVVLIPLFVGIIIYRALKKPDYNPKATAKSNLKFSFFSSFFFYISLSIVLDRISTNIEQRTAIIIVLLCFSIVNVFMSLGFLSLQKLYYIKKFKINL